MINGKLKVLTLPPKRYHQDDSNDTPQVGELWSNYVFLTIFSTLNHLSTLVNFSWCRWWLRWKRPTKRLELRRRRSLRTWRNRSTVCGSEGSSRPTNRPRCWKQRTRNSSRQTRYSRPQTLDWLRRRNRYDHSNISWFIFAANGKNRSAWRMRVSFWTLNEREFHFDEIQWCMTLTDMGLTHSWKSLFPNICGCLCCCFSGWNGQDTLLWQAWIF